MSGGQLAAVVMVVVALIGFYVGLTIEDLLGTGC